MSNIISAMNPLQKDVERYFENLYAAAFNIYNLGDAARYISEKTYRNGQLFSYADYPFQEQALSDTTRNINFMKPAQVGCSEMMARYALALCRIIPCFTTIYVAPFSHDANIFMNTRVNPVIKDSPDLRDALDRNLDNTEIKGFGSSLLFARGASGTTQALSIPADMLIFDELDKANLDIVGQYSSRLRASPWKLTRKLSTPTLANRGIHKATLTSHRWHWVCRCHHCNEVFIPNYEEMVDIPGFSGEKKEINKENLPLIRWEEAVLRCPKCKLVPNLTKEHRFWLCENPTENFKDEVSYIINPFDAPKVHTAASITREITNYNTYGEAQNQVLGTVSTDTQAQLTEEDINACKVTVPLTSGDLHCLGADMGLVCTVMIGRLTQDGLLLVVHREKVLMQNFEVRRRELCAAYNVLMSVIDIQPYTDMVHRIQQYDKNAYGGIYHGQVGAPAFAIKKVAEDLEDGKLPINQARIHRTLGFDELLYMFKNRTIVWAAQDDRLDTEFVNHCLDQKRCQVFDKHNELIYTWEKSDKQIDHFHHALLYLLTACRLMPTVSRDVAFSSMPLIKSFRVKHA